MKKNAQMADYLMMEGVEEVDQAELSAVSGGIAIFMAGFMIGWMIAHHQAKNQGRCR